MPSGSLPLMLDSRATLRLVGIGALGLMMLMGTGCSASAKSDCTHPEASTAVTVSDFSYHPGCLVVAPGSTLTITNHDSAPHTFTIDGTNVDVELGSDASASVQLNGLAPGTYAVSCRYHPQMAQGLRIQ